MLQLAPGQVLDGFLAALGQQVGRLGLKLIFLGAKLAILGRFGERVGRQQVVWDPFRPQAEILQQNFRRDVQKRANAF